MIWSTHQSKALIFYFGIKKILSWIFENFVGNRQTKFHILKFSGGVNTHTLNLNSWNVLCLFLTKFSKIQLQIFSWQNRKSELSIDGLIISVPLLTFGVGKREKFSVKWVKKCTLSALLNFASLFEVSPVVCHSAHRSLPIVRHPSIVVPVNHRPSIVVHVVRRLRLLLQAGIP